MEGSATIQSYCVMVNIITAPLGECGWGKVVTLIIGPCNGLVVFVLDA